MRIITLIALATALILPGCTQVKVKKNPGNHDKGIRFYRPKPYLFIAPVESSGGKAAEAPKDSSKKGDAKTTSKSGIQSTGYFVQEQSGGARLESSEGQTQDPRKQQPSSNSSSGSTTKIGIEIVYLPDFAEEYSIRMTPGLGMGSLDIELKDGWNLTSVNSETDQKFAENVKAVADAATSVAGVFGKNGKPEVLASNVPFGLYEAVIMEKCGKKQLYGWRYVGFAPFQSCPTTIGGQQHLECNCVGAIYGLVYDNGTLQFKQINTIRPPVPVEVAPGTVLQQPSK